MSNCCMNWTCPKCRLKHIDAFGKGLSDWEIKFVADLIDNPPKEFSGKQNEIIERIYDEKC